MKKTLLPIVLLVLFGSLGITASASYAAPPVMMLDAAPVDAGAGSATEPAPKVDFGADFSQLQKDYNALREAKEPKPHLLALAALLAIVLKLLLDVAKVVGAHKYKRAMAWVAMALAVPIALLSHFAGGSSWFDALIFAGAGPGAVIVHELAGAFTKKS